jgi:hypothetical protein
MAPELRCVLWRLFERPKCAGTFTLLHGHLHRYVQAQRSTRHLQRSHNTTQARTTGLARVSGVIAQGIGKLSHMRTVDGVGSMASSDGRQCAILRGRRAVMISPTQPPVPIKLPQFDWSSCDAPEHAATQKLGSCSQLGGSWSARGKPCY